MLSDAIPPAGIMRDVTSALQYFNEIRLVFLKLKPEFFLGRFALGIHIRGKGKLPLCQGFETPVVWVADDLM